ncbi:MAG TPA: hypothetical protein EYP07_02670 [Kiloniellaceae bacterium]|nr:hypothetical protein [Kiloniellaceae bacterium]
MGGLVAKALGTEASPSAVAQAIEADPAALERVRKLELDHEAELTRMHLEAETARLAEVNQTMRAEAASHDPYVRRWRPTFGYLTALARIIQCAAIAWSIVASPEQAGSVAQAVTALTPMWGVALAVLGINVTSRSRDKQVAAGQTPAPGIAGAIARRIMGKPRHG